MTSKRTSDLLLVLSGLQKVADSAVKQECAILDRIIKTSSLPSIPKQGVRFVEPVSLNDVQLLAKKASLVVENSLVLSQALAMSSMQSTLKDLGYYQTAKEKEIIERQSTLKKINEILKAYEAIDGQNEVKYEPNPSITSLVIIGYLQC